MRWRPAVFGVAATVLALGVAELVAVPIGSGSAPLIAVGGAVVDAAPEPLKQFAISVFGVYDKAALLVGMAILLAGFGALVGVLAARSFRLGVAGIAAFTMVGAVAAVTRPGIGPAGALPSLIGGGAAVLALWVVLRPGDRGADIAASDGRRVFLTSVGVVVAVAASAAAGGRWLASRRSVREAREAVRLPAPTQPAPAVPAGADLAVPGLATYVTANRTFYRIDTALVEPQVDPRTWRLRVHGRVRNPVELTFAELLARPMVERYVTLACVSNEVGGDLIGNARWLGTPVADLLAQVRPLAGADQVVSRSVDGWTCGTPTALLRDGRDAMLAVGMNGEPLPVDHGFPVRMVVPGLYGYVSACKWLTELELTSFADFDAYWVRRGWAQQAPIKTQSRIDVPRSGARPTAGPVMVAGVAWAQHRGVEGVEVQVDDGVWQPATLAPTVSVDTWRQWSWRWSATPGRHRLRVRATDATGTTQTGARAPVNPDGATGWHEVTVDVR